MAEQTIVTVRSFDARVDAAVATIADLLKRKNRQYGDSALNPIRCFARDIPVDGQLRVRMDDKLSRLMRGDRALEDEDVILDLAGYLVLFLIARDNHTTNGKEADT
jgi:hypothetical protein